MTTASATRTRNRAHIPEINLPDTPDKPAYTIIGKHILFIEIAQDIDAENPCTEWDGVGAIRSLSSRHIDNISYEEALEVLQNDPDAVPLSYFEHGNSLWMVQDTPAPAGVEFRWDGIKFAGIWIPDKCVRESYMGQDGKSRRDWMIEQAASTCETYTLWENGDVYGHLVKMYTLRTEGGDPYTDLRDYRKVAEVYEDSCWGHFGGGGKSSFDYALEEAMMAVRSALSTIGFSKRAIAKATKETK